MGGELTTHSNVEIEVEVNTPQELTIEIIKNGKIILVRKFNQKHISTQFIDEKVEEGLFWYLLKIRSQGEWALTSPIWVDIQ